LHRHEDTPHGMRRPCDLSHEAGIHVQVAFLTQTPTRSDQLARFDGNGPWCFTGWKDGQKKMEKTSEKPVIYRFFVCPSGMFLVSLGIEKQGQMTVEEELFLQQILEDRDELYRETSRLKSQLSGYENFSSERASYENLLLEKDQAIIKLKQQIEMLQRKIWGKSKKHIEDPQQRKLDFDGLDLRKKSLPPVPKRK
jgi:hypothetical protein